MSEGIYNMIKGSYDAKEHTVTIGISTKLLYAFVAVSVLFAIVVFTFILYLWYRKPEHFTSLQRQLARTIFEDAHEDTVEISMRSNPFYN